MITEPWQQSEPPRHMISDRTKIRDGSVANRPVYVALGINCHGERDVLGLWAGTGGEGAKAWMGILAELRNRGVADLLHRGLRRAQGPA